MDTVHRDDMQIGLQLSHNVGLSFSCQVRACATRALYRAPQRYRVPLSCSLAPLWSTRRLALLLHLSAHRLPALSFARARQSDHVYPNRILSPTRRIGQHPVVFCQTRRVAIHPSDNDHFRSCTSKAGCNMGNGRSRSALTRAVIRAHNTREWRTFMSIVFFELSILRELKPGCLNVESLDESGRVGASPLWRSRNSKWLLRGSRTATRLRLRTRTIVLTCHSRYLDESDRFGAWNYLPLVRGRTPNSSLAVQYSSEDSNNEEK